MADELPFTSFHYQLLEHLHEDQNFRIARVRNRSPQQAIPATLSADEPISGNLLAKWISTSGKPSAHAAAVAVLAKEAELLNHLGGKGAAQLHEFKHDGAASFLISEYLRLGHLRDRLEQGISLQRLVSLFSQVFSALNALHQTGYVHARIQPENIGFRTKAEPLLMRLSYAIQTGTAHADATHAADVTRTQGITEHALATVHPPLSLDEMAYAAPELLNHQPVDFSSDLYSLGIVLFECLTGRRPFSAQQAGDLIRMHSQNSPPRLPVHVNFLQPLLDKLLAKKPASRPASAAEVRDVLDEFADALAQRRATSKKATASETVFARRIEKKSTHVPNNGAATNLAAKPGADATSGVSSSEVSDPAYTLRSAAIAKDEILGVSDQFVSLLEQSKGSLRRSQRLNRQKWTRRSLLLILVLGFAGLLYEGARRDYLPLGALATDLGLTEDPALTAAWREAQSIAQDANQSLEAVYAGYQRVLAIDPNFRSAQEAMLTLVSEWKTQIGQDLKTNTLASAEIRLAEAIDLFPNDSDFQVLSLQLQSLQRAERLMANTQTLLDSYGLSNPAIATAAIQAFQEVLRIAPNHAGAQQGLATLSDHYVGLATTAVEDGLVNDAINLLERAAAADNQNKALDDVRLLISEAANIQAAIDQLLLQASRYRSEDQLLSPRGENAAELYQRVLATDPDNAIALQGLNEVKASVMSRLINALAQADVGNAEQLYVLANNASLATDFLADMRSRIDAEQDRQEEVRTTLASAQELIAQGYLTAPANNNAVALLRRVLQLEPSNSDAQRLMRRIAARLVAVAREARKVEIYDGARRYLDLALAILPEETQWVRLREEWNDTNPASPVK